jgi:hypothetical protein
MRPRYAVGIALAFAPLLAATTASVHAAKPTSGDLNMRIIYCVDGDDQ